MRLIDADALEERIKVEGRNQAEQRANRYDNVVLAYGDCFGMVRDAPTIDAVLVVRCKDCKHYDTIGRSKGFGWCENIDRGTSDNFYCSLAERSEG